MLIYSINTEVKDNLFADTISSLSPGGYVHFL
jgi:hypothetical protein